MPYRKILSNAVSLVLCIAIFILVSGWCGTNGNDLPDRGKKSNIFQVNHNRADDFVILEILDGERGFENTFDDFDGFCFDEKLGEFSRDYVDDLINVTSMAMVDSEAKILPKLLRSDTKEIINRIFKVESNEVEPVSLSSFYAKDEKTYKGDHRYA